MVWRDDQRAMGFAFSEQFSPCLNEALIQDIVYVAGCFLVLFFVSFQLFSIRYLYLHKAHFAAYLRHSCTVISVTCIGILFLNMTAVKTSLYNFESNLLHKLRIWLTSLRYLETIQISLLCYLVMVNMSTVVLISFVRLLARMRPEKEEKVARMSFLTVYTPIFALPLLFYVFVAIIFALSSCWKERIESFRTICAIFSFLVFIATLSTIAINGVHYFHLRGRRNRRKARLNCLLRTIAFAFLMGQFTISLTYFAFLLMNPDFMCSVQTPIIGLSIDLYGMLIPILCINFTAKSTGPSDSWIVIF
ncbi:unnamed protein product, partial [Mesorhabditis belari]|uniref:Uncharacterized protein n=1 Tax=Mesorhabditis belari TaxID=2138241 RepID=A0AAF3ER73_9BILA